MSELCVCQWLMWKDVFICRAKRRPRLVNLFAFRQFESKLLIRFSWHLKLCMSCSNRLIKLLAWFNFDLSLKVASVDNVLTYPSILRARVTDKRYNNIHSVQLLQDCYYNIKTFRHTVSVVYSCLTLHVSKQFLHPQVYVRNVKTTQNICTFQDC